MLFDYFG